MVLLFQTLLHTEFHHFPEQFPGHGLVVGQMQGAFCVGQLAETISEGIDCLLARMESHVFLLCGEVYQVALQHKGRYPLGDFLRNIRMTAVNQCPQSDHSFLDFAIIGGDVFVNIGHGNPSL